MTDVPLTEVSLRIDRIAVEIDQDQQAERAEEAVRTALALLATRLARSPLGLADSGPALALGMVDVGPVEPGWLAGPGAADRLAEMLYEKLLDARGGGARAR